MTPLHGHVSPETAYLVSDYPYGFRLRCRCRYWIETHPKRGSRLVTQTSDPKREAVVLGHEVWNRPKTATYHRIAAGLYLDHEGHVACYGLSEYDEDGVALRFAERYPEHRVTVLAWALGKASLASYQRTEAEAGRSCWTINGAPRPLDPGDVDRYRAEVDGWLAVVRACKAPADTTTALTP